MYDELVKELRGEYGYDTRKDIRVMKAAADAIEELIQREADMTHNMAALSLKVLRAEEKLPRWIPVTERLPEHAYGEGDSVLTVSSLGSMRVLYFDGGNWCYPTGETLTTAWKFPITHWMPLPQPPKE